MAANRSVQKKNGGLPTGGLVRYMTQEEMVKLQIQEGMINCPDALGPADSDFNGRDMQAQRAAAQSLLEESKGKADNGQGPVAKFAIKEGGTIHMVTLEVAVEKLRAKEQALSEETDQMKIKLELEIAKIKRNDPGARDRSMKLVKQIRATDRLRMSFEAQLQEMTGQVGAACVPGPGGIGRYRASQIVEDTGGAGTATLTHGPDKLGKDGNTKKDPNLFEQSANMLESGGSVAFLDEDDDMASKIVSGETGLLGWEIARMLCFELNASATTIRDLMPSPAFRRAEIVRTNVARFLRPHDRMLERNLAEFYASLIQGSHGCFRFTTIMESLLAVPTETFQKAWDRGHVAFPFLRNCALIDEDVMMPRLTLWYEEAGGDPNVRVREAE
eukprot:CAMPEP_0119512052 /NCGR_PEP_ID=MMETSP1344-20130328/30526_1 /TAXON_ID=236787 /ORGANISM="Florenciella parvula, Strain CCMP2471" /LENGTH=386 /DNA_ID=CAMNT_0007549121 /DNA_START=222 /DNA_END=1379 /DNA_ORIENTATION=+